MGIARNQAFYQRTKNKNGTLKKSILGASKAKNKNVVFVFLSKSIRAQLQVLAWRRRAAQKNSLIKVSLTKCYPMLLQSLITQTRTTRCMIAGL